MSKLYKVDYDPDFINTYFILRGTFKWMEHIDAKRLSGMILQLKYRSLR